jgi:hypothetical protein
MSLLLEGYQISSSTAILFLNFAVFVQLFVVVATRPYI